MRFSLWTCYYFACKWSLITHLSVSTLHHHHGNRQSIEQALTDLVERSRKKKYIRIEMVNGSPDFVGGCFALFTVGTLSAAGGVGGGGLALPLLLFVFDYELNEAVRYSLCFVLGNANWQFLLNIYQPNPFRPAAPLVSIVWWELVALSLPGLLGGANLGSLLATIAPDSLRYLLALLLLIVISFFTFDKGLKQHQKEIELKTNREMIPVATSSEKVAEQLENNSVEMIEVDQEIAIELGSPMESPLDSPSTAEPSEGSSKAMLTLSSSLLSPSSPLPAIIITALAWVVNLVLSIRFTQLDVCTLDYRVSFGTANIPIFVFTVCIIWYYGRDPSEAHSLKQIESRLFQKIPFAIPLSSFLIGVLTSLLGIGGGEVLIPLMLHFHIPPTVSSATATCLGFLNVFTLVIRALDAGVLSISTGAVMYFLGATSGLAGRAMGLYVSSKLHKASVIVMLLGIVLLLSVAYYLYRLSDEPFVTVFKDRCP